MHRVLIVTLTLTLAVSCGRETTAPQSGVVIDESVPQEGGTIIRRLQADVATLNPVIPTSRYDRLVMNYLFTPLVALDIDLKPAPALATKWEISPDGLNYVFHLDPKATFSDGTPVHASDVLFTLKKIVDPTTEAAQVSAGFDKLDLTRTRIIDDHTIAVGFKEAFAPQLTHFNDVLVMPEHVYSKGDFKTGFNFNAVGSGPYKLVRRVAEQEIVLKRREDYWAKKPYLETVIFKPVIDFVTAWNALKRGDIDESEITSDIWAANSTRPDLQKTIEFRRFYYLTYNTIAWNNKGPVLNDKRVRRALAQCVDLKSIINNLYHGTARAMNGPFTPDQWAYNPTVPVIEFDPIAAQHALNAIGWLDTDHDGILDKDHKPLKVDLLVFAGNPPAQQFGELLQSELKKIGVVLTLTPMEPTALLQRILAGNYDAAYLSWDLDPDPDPYPLLHSSQWPPHGQNVVFYKNPEADALIDAGRKEFNQSKRTDIYRKLHELVAADQPYTWTVQVSVKWGMNKRVHGVRESKGWGLFLWFPGEYDWWIPATQRTHDAPATQPKPRSSRMSAYLARRVAYAILTFFGITIVTFTLIHSVPGDPVTFYIGKSGIHGVPPQILQAIRHEYHLDETLPVQYAYWLKGVLTFDFGPSVVDHRPAMDRILEKLPNTFILNFIAFALAALAGIPIGLWSASRSGHLFERGSSVVFFLLYSLPSFWVALLLMELFAVRHTWLPLFGMTSDGYLLMSSGAKLADRIQHLVLPTLALTYAQLAFYARFTKAALTEVIHQDFITTARAKGVSGTSVMWRHAFRNALLPLVTLLGLTIPYLLSGSVIIETMFEWDGVGKLYLQSLMSRDYPTVLALTVVTAVVTLFASVLSDVLYALADPRVRVEGKR